MSKKQHQRQVDRARAQRQQDRTSRRQRRQRLFVWLLIGALVLSLTGGVLLATLLGDDDDAPAAAPDEPATTPEEDPLDGLPEAVCPDPDGPLPGPVTEPYEEAPRFEVDPDVTYVATLVTTCGDIELELDTQGSPRTAENFLALAADGFYDGTPFHRIMPDFVIQGGDPAGNGTGCVDPACETRLPGFTLEDEPATAEALEPAELGEGFPEGLVIYPRGILAMANSGPDTQGSQFFVVVADDGQPFPPAYTVFGRVLDGMRVVDDIVAGPAIGDQAVDPVIVLEVRIEER